MNDSSGRLVALRARLAKLDRSSSTGLTRTTLASGSAFLDNLQTCVVHDLYAETPADAAVLNAFGLGLASKTAAGKPIVWAIHRLVENETGAPHGPGLNAMGVDPRDVILIRVGDIQTLLAVGEEALRSAGVGAVLLSAWGEARTLTLTASRRLALAARGGTATLFLARAGATPSHSAAETRWSVRSAPSIPLEGGAPGRPSFSVTLLRHRGGVETRTSIMEWDRETRSFRERPSISGAVVSVAAQRPAEATGTGEWRVA